MRVLTVNTGSSSVKLRLLGPDDAVLAEHEHDAPGIDIDPVAMGAAIERLGDADVVAHRVVHGGRRRAAARIDAALAEELGALTPLAPLHQPKALAAAAAVKRARADLPAVACFDTAFHAGLPAAAATYAVPVEWRERFALRRYGFHGLSHAYATRRAAGLLRLGDGARIVSCHLGAGASLAAVRDGRSLDTTMGFTPLEGIVMATRSGSVDPGLVLWLVRQGLAPEDVHDALEHQSGLKALAGTPDMREVLARDDDAARLALEVYLHRLAGAAAAMAAALGGLEALVFTGGVGEHASAIRAGAAERLAFLGVALDAASNRDPAGDADLSVRGATVRVAVVAAREDVEMARQARAALGA
ncbi:MAG TPA: acetate/propionate family kinase [Solirubrobacteraceae bacterium]|nr:acetate/propionate family kinase [Solirubrobacteraceae bacterium]